MCAQPNQLNPIVQRAGVVGGTTSGGIFMTGGASTDSATIIVEIGTPGTDYDYGSQYVCSTTGTIFVATATGTWLKITTT